MDQRLCTGFVRLVPSVIFFAIMMLFTAPAHAWHVERVNLSSEGHETTESHSAYSSISHDGRFVSFSTAASNLVPNDTNNLRDIFVRDRKLRTTTRVNVAGDGSQITDYPTLRSQLSGDGRFVVFDSRSSDLAPGGVSADITNVYLHELETGETVLISTGHDGSPADGHSAYDGKADISYDGRYIVFHSDATNLVSGDTNAKMDVFVYDREDESISLVTRAHGGGLADGNSRDPAISANGRYIVFSSGAKNLVEGVAPTGMQIYRYDRETGEILLVSSAEGGAADDYCWNASVSGDGLFVVFRSAATNLSYEVPTGNSTRHLYLKDMASGAITLVSKNAEGEPGDGNTIDSPKISPDSRYVLFNSQAKNLLSDNTIIESFFSTAFLYDQQEKTVSLMPTMSSGVVPSDPCSAEDIADEGKFVTFSSTSYNLVPNDTNEKEDVFVAVQLTDAWSISPTAQLGGWRNDVAVEGNIAALAEGLSVSLYNISGDTPQKLSSLALPVEPTLIGISGTKLYAVSGPWWDDSRFIVADISNTAAPAILGSCSASSPGGSMAIRGNDVYYSSGWSSDIGLIDVSDPSSPELKGNLNLGDAVEPHAFTIKDDLLYVQGIQYSEGMFLVFSLTGLTDPLAPDSIGDLAVGSQRSESLHAVGTLVYSAVGNNGVGVTDVSDPEHPSPSALFAVTDDVKTYEAQDVYASGNLLYVAAKDGGVFVYDMSNFLSPQRLGTVPMTDAIKVDGSTGGVAALSQYPGDDALIKMGFSSGTTPVALGTVTTPAIASGLVSLGNHLYVGGEEGLYVYDASDPASPELLSRSTHKNFLPLARIENRLVGLSSPADTWGKKIFSVIDVTDPTSPTLLGDYTSDGDFTSGVVSGNVAFLLRSEVGAGAEIIDFSNPSSPTKVGILSFPSVGPGSQSQGSVAASGALACVAGRTAQGKEIHIFDVTTPSAPVHRSTLPASGEIIRLTMIGTTLIVSANSGNFSDLQAFDLSDPVQPEPAGSLVTDKEAADIKALSDGENDPIILMAKPGGSVHTYGYNPSSGSFYHGPVCPSPYSTQVTVSPTPNRAGGYTVATSDSSYGSYIQEITKKPTTCCLTTGVMPLEAAADGCTAEPVREDPVECNSSVGVSATPAEPWVFKEWTGAAQGTAPQSEALVTGSCSHATAWFWRPELTLSPGPRNPSDSDGFYGIAGQFDYENGAVNIPIIHITLTANEVDDWKVMGLTFQTDGTGNEKEDVIEARLYLEDVGGTLLGIRTFSADDGNLAFGFAQEVIIRKGESRSFLVVYDFKPERTWPCNNYEAAINVGGVSAVPINYPPGVKLPPLPYHVTGGPSAVKRGYLVIDDGNEQYGQADDPESENDPLEKPLKVRLAWQHPASVNHVSYYIDSPPQHGGFLAGEPGTRRVQKPVEDDGYVEEIMTLGTKKGKQNPYYVRMDMSLKGDTCGYWVPPAFLAWGMGLDLATESQYDNPDNGELFGTFLSTIQAENLFTLTIDMAPEDFAEVQEVLFTMGGQTVVGTEVTPNVEYNAEFDMSEFQSPQKMLVTIVMKKDGSTVEQTAEYDVKVLKLPEWVSVVDGISDDFSMEFDGEDSGVYNFAFTYPTNFIWSDTIPGDVGFLGGLGNDLDIEFTAEAAYRVDETSVFGAVVQGEPTILGYEFGLEGGLSGEFDSNFAFQRGNGTVRAEFGFDLPSKGYSKTFLIYGVPITAAVDLSGNVDIFIRGGAVLNRQVEFEEVTVAPGTTVTGHITVSLSAVFGLAKIAATGSPTATVEIEIRYTTADGTTTTWQGEVAVPISVVGSIFWGLGSAELYSTTLGPWMFGDGVRAPLAFRPLGDLPTLPAPRLLTTSALAVGGEGRRMSVWIEDTEPDEPFPNPDVFFRFFDGDSWTEPSPVIGIKSPNDEWEMDPAAVFMAANNALSCWTANRGDKELSDLNAILAAQEIACAVWNGSGWGDPVYLTDDDRADGLVNLAYGGGNTFAVWIHSADRVDVLDRTAWELRYAVYDKNTGQWEPPAPVPGTDTGFSDQMPSVAANGEGGVVLIWARDDDGVFYTENEKGPDGDPLVINGTTIASEDNEDSHIMWSQWTGTAWSPPAYAATGGTATRLFPSLAASPDGSYLAVWTEKAPGKKPSIKYSVLSGTTWSTPGTVVESDQYLEEPKAVVSASGRATVIWRGYTGGGEALFSSSTPSLTASEWSEPEQITHDKTVPWQPVVAVETAGEDEQVVTSWTGYDVETGSVHSGPGFGGGINVAVVNPGTAELTGDYGVVLPDADEDGLYDGVVFSLEVEINEAGAYEARGDLYAGTKFITRASDYWASLDEGVHTFHLVFPGGLVSNRGLDGPYSLKNVVVIDRSGSAVSTASVSTAVTTDAYGASQFAPGPLSLDRALYVGTLDQAVITVKDPALNKDAGAIEQMSVRVSSTGDRKGFNLVLIETGHDTGLFRETLRFSLTGSNKEARKILVSDQTRIDVIYKDETGVNWSEDAIWTAGGAADVNGDGVTDLKDAIIALQIITGSVPLGTELNRAAALSSDRRIGAAVAVYILRELSVSAER